MSRPQQAAASLAASASELAPASVNEEVRLEALEQYRILDSFFEPEYDDLTRIVAHICRTPIAAIDFIGRHRQWFKSEIGLGIREIPRDLSISAHALRQPGLFIVSDLQKDHRFARNPLVAGEPYLRFYAGALLQTSDGFGLGTLCVLDYEPRELNEHQKHALQALARQVMTLIELRHANDAQGEMLISLERAASEKAVLLEELQHRAKNNAQMISGLVQLQSRREATPEARQALDKLRHRLESLVLLNSQFDRSGSADHVDLAAYLRKLCLNLTELNAVVEGAVRLDLDLDPIDVRTDTGLRVGMIANEFITNSFKHVFRAGGGTLTAKLSHNGEYARLELADNGPGLPSSVREDGLGLQIIPSLATQIGATVEWPTGEGTRLIVTWTTGQG